MEKSAIFENVWDALEDDQIHRKNLELRSEAMIVITEKVGAMGLKQVEAAKHLGISQPRVSALLRGKIEKFRLDSLVDMAHRLGLNVSIQIAA